MFFKKHDSISEEQIVAIGITAATICHIVESRYPSTSVEGHVKYVNDAVDTVLKNIKLNPNPEMLNYIKMVASALEGDSGSFIANRVARFQAGQKGVDQSEIQQALVICQKSVNEFMRGR